MIFGVPASWNRYTNLDGPWFKYRKPVFWLTPERTFWKWYWCKNDYQRGGWTTHPEKDYTFWCLKWGGNNLWVVYD